jgi:hypothetical protein
MAAVYATFMKFREWWLLAMERRPGQPRRIFRAAAPVIG